MGKIKKKTLDVINDKNKRNNVLNAAGIAAATIALAALGLIIRSKLSGGNNSESEIKSSSDDDNISGSRCWYW